jgi:DNA-binding SARP family transcriptional activator/DNA-binding NarL/FixJ family response regulator
MFRDSHTILVVDPDERSYRTFESVLGSENSVWFVPNSKTAIELPDSKIVDVIFVSHALNGADGNLLLESFKKRFPSIPVVVLAENPTVDEVLSAFRRGARELILKPLDEKELVTITKKIFGFVSRKRPKRRWFFPDRKDTQKNNPENNSPGPLKKIFKKSKQIECSAVAESDEFQIKKTGHLADDSNHPLIVDPIMDGQKPNKIAYIITPPKTPHLMIEAFFFGPFRAFLNSQPIENYPSKKGKLIFAYLLLNHKKKIFRDVLMDIFWQKSSPDSARNCLNVAIHGLRRVLEDIDSQNEYILFKDECYYFNSEIEIQLDVETFRKTWQNAQNIEQHNGLSAAISEYQRAAGLYKDDLLEDEIYDGWSSLDRENLKEVYLVILDKISENLMQQHNHYEAAQVCEKILGKDNCREDIYRRLMVSYYRLGQRDKSLKLFRKCSRVLKEELDVKLTPLTIELFKKIKENQL